MSAQLAGNLPKGPMNGLAAIAGELVADPHRVHVVIALVDCKKTTTDNDTGEVIPTARIRRIEAIKDADDGKSLVRLIRRQFERRTGQTVLPLDLEDDINAAFDGLDDNPDS